MKLLSAEQFSAADQFTIANTPIKSIDLMEVAAKACFEWCTANYSTHFPFLIFCGKGNNGGDGLALARMLHQKGYDVTCYIIHFTKDGSSDFKENLVRLENLNIATYGIEKAGDFPTIPSKAILVDAIFGTGLSRPAEGLVADCISLINQTANQVVSIDLPSGMFVDKLNTPNDIIVKATHNLSFELPKLNSLLPEYEQFIEEQHILPIGLNANYIAQIPSNKSVITLEEITKTLKKRKKHSHKGTYGFCCVIAGSYGAFGAAILATKAVLKSGAGKCVVHLPKSGNTILQISVPEAMVHDNSGENELSAINDYTLFNDKTLVIGPGIGTAKHTISFLEELFKNTKSPLIIDADALNCITLQPSLWKHIPKNSILTPHPKEFERLFGKTTTSYQQIEKLLHFAKEKEVIILLKGATSILATPSGSLYFNTTGNPGMATAGSGDVLTGILGGLLAQGYSPIETAKIGVYLHGLAGDIAAKELTHYALMAGDLIRYLPKAFKKILTFA